MNTETKNKLTHRLKIIEGQVRGLQKMIEEDTYCVDVITQTSAVRHSLSSVEDTILESHLTTCAMKQVTSGKEDQMIEEILSVYKLAKKK